MTKRALLLRVSIGAGALLAIGVLFFLLADDRIGGAVPNLLLFACFLLAGMCVLFPTKAERTEMIYRLSSPVRLALGCVGIGVFLWLLVLMFTSSGWDPLGYLILLVYYSVPALLLFLSALAFKIVFWFLHRRKKKSE